MLSGGNGNCVLEIIRNVCCSIVHSLDCWKFLFASKKNVLVLVLGSNSPARQASTVSADSTVVYRLSICSPFHALRWFFRCCFNFLQICQQLRRAEWLTVYTLYQSLQARGSREPRSTECITSFQISRSSRRHGPEPCVPFPLCKPVRNGVCFFALIAVSTRI